MDVQSILQLLGSQADVQRVQEGHSNFVYIILDQSGKQCAVRVPKNDDAAELAQRGATIIRHIKNSEPSLTIPEVVHEDPRFLTLSYIEGDSLRVWNHKVLDESRRHQLLHDLAGTLWKIWTCPVAPFQTMRSLTYREWLFDEVDKGILRSLNNEGWGDPIHFLFRRAKIDSLVPPENNEDMSIRHGDLSACNVLVDDRGLTGIIDWDFAKVVPLPAAVQHPDFIADTPGFINEGVDEGLTFADDREFFEKEIRRLADESTVQGAERIPTLLETSFQRRFFEMSLRNRKINAEWCRMTGDVPEGVALEQLEAFIAANPESGDDGGIEQLLATLRQ